MWRGRIWLPAWLVLVSGMALVPRSARAQDQEARWRDLHDAGSKALERGNFAEAERLFKDELAVSRSLPGRAVVMAASYDDLASLYFSTGRYAQAEPLIRRALAIREEAQGKEHPNVVSDLNSLAVLACAGGRLAEAESLHRRALALREKALGPTTRTSRSRSITWPMSSVSRGGTPTRNASCAARWRSRRRCWGPTTSTWPAA